MVHHAHVMRLLPCVLVALLSGLLHADLRDAAPSSADGLGGAANADGAPVGRSHTGSTRLDRTAVAGRRHAVGDPHVRLDGDPHVQLNGDPPIQHGGNPHVQHGADPPVQHTTGRLARSGQRRLAAPDHAELSQSGDFRLRQVVDGRPDRDDRVEKVDEVPQNQVADGQQDEPRGLDEKLGNGQQDQTGHSQRDPVDHSRPGQARSYDEPVRIDPSSTASPIQTAQSGDTRLGETSQQVEEVSSAATAPTRHARTHNPDVKDKLEQSSDLHSPNVMDSVPTESQGHQHTSQSGHESTNTTVTVTHVLEERNSTDDESLNGFDLDKSTPQQKINDERAAEAAEQCEPDAMLAGLEADAHVCWIRRGHEAGGCQARELRVDALAARFDMAEHDLVDEARLRTPGPLRHMAQVAPHCRATNLQWVTHDRTAILAEQRGKTLKMYLATTFFSVYKHELHVAYRPVNYWCESPVLAWTRFSPFQRIIYLGYVCKNTNETKVDQLLMQEDSTLALKGMKPRFYDFLVTDFQADPLGPGIVMLVAVGSRSRVWRGTFNMTSALEMSPTSATTSINAHLVGLRDDNVFVFEPAEQGFTINQYKWTSEDMWQRLHCLYKIGPFFASYRFHFDLFCEQRSETQ